MKFFSKLLPLMFFYLMQNRVTNLIIYKRELFNRSRNIGTAKNIQTYILLNEQKIVQDSFGCMHVYHVNYRYYYLLKLIKLRIFIHDRMPSYKHFIIIDFNLIKLA